MRFYNRTNGKPFEAQTRERVERQLYAVFAVYRPYLFLPFSGLCLAIAPIQGPAGLLWALIPILLQMISAAAYIRLKRRFGRRGPLTDPRDWAFRLTVISGLCGAAWGLGALLWFDPSSPEQQAALALAFLGLSALEGIARMSYRPAYFAHAVPALLPLAGLFAFQGGPWQHFAVLAMAVFSGTLYASGNGAEAQFSGNAIKAARPNPLKEEASRQNDNPRFIAELCGELHTPISSMLAMAGLLENSDLPKSERDHAKRLSDAGKGLKILLDDIALLANPGGDAAKDAAMGCDAGQTARIVARLIEPSLWEKRLRLSLNVAADLPRVAADVRLIRRVLLRLAANTIKSTDIGSVEIAIAPIETSDGGNAVRFSVTGNGPGIPVESRAALFEPFAQSGAYRSQTMSLDIAKRLVEATGGTLEIENRPGAGASFWFVVPSLDIPAASNDPVTAESPSGLALLGYIPDDVMRLAIDRALTPHGNRIVFAETLAEATAISVRGHFLAVLTQASAVSALAAAPGQRMPILALVRHDEEIPVGADRCLRWPASEDGLFAALRSVIGVGGTSEILAGGEPAEAGIEALALELLEKSLGVETMIGILQSYMTSSEALAAALIEASSRSDWTQVSRLAMEFSGAASGLGLAALTAAARTLAKEAHDRTDLPSLHAAASTLVSEHQRVFRALRKHYPALSA